MNKLTIRLTLGVLLALVTGPLNAQSSDTNGNKSDNKRGEILRDPTKPLSYTTSPTVGPQLTLQAILRRDSGTEAIINGERVRVGSSVAGASIEAIGKQNVIYSYQGERHRLQLRPTIRK